MDRLSEHPITMCLSKVTLAAGTTSTISNTGTITYAINSFAYTKTAMTNVATPTVDAMTGLAFPSLTANKGAVVVIGLDKDANVKACQGKIVDLDASGAFVLAPEYPLIPDTMCPIGAIILKAGATLSGTWTFGTNNLSGVTGMTYTFKDLVMLPSRPFTS